MGMSILLASVVGFGSALAGGKAPENKAVEESLPTVVKDCPQPGPYLSLDYLYWKAEEDGLAFAISLPQGLSGKKGSVIDQHFAFDSGFRAGIGYDLPYEKYDILLNWTRFHTHQKTHDSSNNHSLFAVLLTGAGSGNLGDLLIDAVISKWHLEFDMLDLEMGKKYFVGRRLSLRPHIGLKGGWIDQRQNVSYFGLGATGEPAKGSVKRDNDYQGIGPRIGMDMRWGIAPQFGIFGNVSGALLYGPSHAKTHYFISSSSLNVDLTIPNSGNHVCPTAQMLLGGDWSRCLYNKWWIRFAAAYEVQFWWNQWQAFPGLQSILVTPSGTPSDLTLHGLTLQARFDF